MDFDEYKRCLALCGMSMFRNVSEMKPAERVQALVDVYIGANSSGLPDDRVAAAVRGCLSKSLARFEPQAMLPSADVATLPPELLECWGKMDLADLHGWPLWEGEVFSVLADAFEELSSIFTHYAKSGQVGSDAQTYTMQQTEVSSLAIDCGLTHRGFAMARVHQLMAKSDQLDGADAAARAGGDKALEFFEFCELLVRVAFYRANPKYGTRGFEHDVRAPLPECLRQMVRQQVLRYAKRDTLKEVLAAIREDAAVQAALDGRKKELQKAFQQCARAAGGLKRGGAPQLPMAAFIDDLNGRGLIKDVDIKPTPAVVGTVLPSRHSNLSLMDVKGAFATCQQKGDEPAEASNMHADFREFCDCLALCGHVKYAAVDEMSLLQRVAGMLANYLGEEDEHAIITDAVAPKLERFDAKSAVALSGQSPKEHRRWLTVWGKMDLSQLHGFPVWEKEVFDELQRAFEA
eukprot:4613903-Prymnesium_polylepis.1